VDAIGVAPYISNGLHSSDIGEGSTFYTRIATAYNWEVVLGCSDGAHKPAANATRGR